MAYQIGLCDDEEYQIKINGTYLKKIAEKKGYDLEFHGFKSGSALRGYLAEGHLDALLLDIDFGDESGVDIAAWVARNYPDIVKVFVTGHREFAEEAFEVEAVGYLVKPYDAKKMEVVMEKVITILDRKKQADAGTEIVIIDENIKKKIDCRDILYIERQQAKSIIKTRDDEYQVYETITSLCERIGDSFIRVNQGEVVHKSQIAQIKGNVAHLKNGMEMSIGRTYRKSVQEKYFGQK